MEKIVENFYYFTIALGAHPYKVNLIPGTPDF